MFNPKSIHKKQIKCIKLQGSQDLHLLRTNFLKILDLQFSNWKEVSFKGKITFTTWHLQNLELYLAGIQIWTYLRNIFMTMMLIFTKHVFYRVEDRPKNTWFWKGKDYLMKLKLCLENLLNLGIGAISVPAEIWIRSAFLDDF